MITKFLVSSLLFVYTYQHTGSKCSPLSYPHLYEMPDWQTADSGSLLNNDVHRNWLDTADCTITMILMDTFSTYHDDGDEGGEILTHAQSMGTKQSQASLSYLGSKANGLKNYCMGIFISVITPFSSFVKNYA